MVVYAEPGRRDPFAGRVLALTRQYDGELPEGTRTVRIRRFGEGHSGGQGDIAWIGWTGTADEGADPPHYGVVGKGLTERQIRSAADAIDKKHLRIAPSGMAAGLRPIAEVPMGLNNADVSFGAGITQRWTSGPRRWLTVRTMRGDERVETLARMMTFGRPTRIRGDAGMAGSVVYPVGHTRTLTRAWRENGAIVTVTAQGIPDSEVDALIASLRPVSGGGLEALRSSISRYPPERLAGPGERLVASGRDAQTMWAVFAKPLGRPGAYSLTERGRDGRGRVIGGGSAGLDVPRQGMALAGTAEADGRFVEGAVGADVARVRLTLADGQSFGLPLSRPIGAEGARWFGTWVEASRGRVREVTALGRHGRIVARRTYP
ncbi:hypothetical protein [Actinomadura fibrosa]|uniref:hypothetical protein n=1 Tax=Actinomadura fibrosa TaxID=111802 RepID=UPI0010418DB2|nr:hypothetical protein [Actinomadura fibrosa]